MKTILKIALLPFFTVCLFMACRLSKEPLNTPENTPFITPMPIEVYDIGEYYKIKREKDDIYHIMIFDKSGEIIYEDRLPLAPYINTYDDIVKLTISLGSPNSYVHFVNIETKEVSDVFYNPSLVDKGRIVYMENGKLIVSDIFNRDNLYKEIVRDFSPVVVDCNAVRQIKFIGDNKMYFEYLEGENFDLKSETIDLREP